MNAPALNKVYFAQNPHYGWVKIGYSSDVRNRLSALSTGAGCDLHLLRYLDGGRPTERWLHKRFSDLRVKGEWFVFDPEMLTVIPPDEIISPVRVIERRDVRLTVKEKFAQASANADVIGLSDKQMLLTFVSELTDAHARELREYIGARTGQAA